MRNPVTITVVALAGLAAHVARRLVVDPRTRRIRRGLLVSGGLLAAGLGAHAWLTHASSARLAEALAALRAAKEPVTPLDLAPPPCAFDANAAPRLQQALALFASEPDADSEAIGAAEDAIEAGTPIAPEHRAALERWLAANKDVLARVESMLPLDRRCRFELDYSNGLEVPLPHLMPAKQVARLLAVRALLEAETDPDRALATLAKARDLPRTLDEDPFLISWLVRVAASGIAHAGFARFLDRHEPSEAALRAYAAGIDAAAPPPDGLARAFVAERATMREAFALVRAGDPRAGQLVFPGAAPAWTRLYRWSDWLVNGEELAYLELTGEIIAASRRLDGKALLAELERIEASAARAPLAHLFLPAGDRHAKRHLAARARRDLEKAAVALRLERLRTGSYPESLATPPLDPFTGEPVRYRREGKGFLLECPGAEAVNEKGCTLRVSR